MSRVPCETRVRSLVEEDVAEEALASLRREIDAVKAKVEEHRRVMRLAGLTGADDPDTAQKSR